mmetsp:Transcript_14395/g.26045  ORF Transcript_14395/g.26045 Transcript_14395/m.26045 type:complete len:282 (+) Transcript_14395:139-984(+)
MADPRDMLNPSSSSRRRQAWAQGVWPSAPGYVPAPAEWPRPLGPGPAGPSSHQWSRPPHRQPRPQTGPRSRPARATPRPLRWALSRRHRHAAPSQTRRREGRSPFHRRVAPSPYQSAGPSPYQSAGPSPCRIAGPSPCRIAGLCPCRIAGPCHRQNVGPCHRPDAVYQRPGVVGNAPHRPHRPHRAKRSGPRKSGVPSPGWARRTPLTAPSLHPRRPLCPAPCSRMRPEVRRRPTGQCRSGRCSSRCSAGYSPCAGLARLRSWTSSPRRSASWSGGDGPLA